MKTRLANLRSHKFWSKGMSRRPRLLVLAATGLLASCTLPTATRQSVADIRAREPVLFSQEAYYGNVLAPSGTLSWNGRAGPEPGDLVLTPTTLYFVYRAGDLWGSRSIAISYAAIARTEVGSGWGYPLTFPPPWQKARPLPDQLHVHTVAGGAGATYAGTNMPTQFAFHLVGPAGRRQSDGAAARRARTIIDRQRQKVGASGLTTPARRTAVAPHYGTVITNWQLQDALAKCGGAKSRLIAGGSIRNHFSPPGTDWREVFHRECQAALRRHPTGSEFRLLPAVPASTNFTDHAEKLSRAKPALHQLIIINLARTSFHADASGSRVTATYTIETSFLDLKPAKPGYSRTLDHGVTRTAREWMDGGQALIHADLRQAIRRAVNAIPGGR